LLAARAIVIDLRHNNGGSSSWSRQAAESLWGETPVKRALAGYFGRAAIWWRASPDNIAYMTQIEQQVRGNGNIAYAETVRQLQADMRSAAERNQPYHIVPVDAADPAAAAPATASDFRVPVYVITPGRCASACLDALDVFTRFPNTRLVGAPTSGDSTYMDVRTAPLPSGRGRIVVPLKIWTGRPRASGEIYRPHIQVDALDWSTATFLDLIERDLTARAG
jgi:hypothetical protein